MLKKLGKYELIEQIGHGAMGEVYKAHDPSIGRLVALKTIIGTLVANPELLDRFYQEARSAGTLQHPNIVTVYELGRQNDSPFIAMEFLEGESLEKIIDRRPVLPLSQKVGFMVPVCRALDYAHKRGVVHRDIKPGNVMLTKDGTIKVVDFGIARLVDASKTQTNMMIGTMGYMSPQQFRGERADQRSDIWAVGVMLYELLCLRRPFEGDDAPALILNIVDEKKHPPSVRDLCPDCSPELEALIGKMLRKDANERFQTMEEVLFELEPIWRNLQEEGISGLIIDSEVLIRAQDFPRARDLLRKALQIDSRNDRAKVLLDQLNAETRRLQIRSQLNSALEKGQTLLSEGRHQEARAEAEAALKLDSTFAPAHDLLAQVQRALNRERQVQESIRLAKLRLAEGALTEANEALQKALDLEAANVPARTLQKQIQDQLARRVERKKLLGILQRARECWADQRLQECITLLSHAQSEFPGDPEIAKLLETAKHDQAEQQMREKLAEARSLLAVQRYDDSLAILESLSQQKPGDFAVQKLRDLVLQEKEAVLRQHELQKQIANLHSLVNSEKFSEAASRGEILMREFSCETEIAEIVNFARGELAQVEQRRDFDAVLQGVRRNIYAGKFREAVDAAEKAIARFPRHPELDDLLQQARTKLKEEENRELLQKRIAEIRRNIAGAHLTNAADLARQTLSTLGPDTQVTSLLRVAEMEITYKLEKKEEHQKQIALVRNLLAQSDFNAAAQAIQDGLESKVLSDKDPEVSQLLKEVELQKAAAVPPEPTPPPSPTVELTSAGDIAKDYVFLQRAPTPQPSLQNNASMADSSELALSAAAGTGSSVRPRPPIPTPVPIEVSSRYQEKEHEELAHATTSPAEESSSESQVLQPFRNFTEVFRERSLFLFRNVARIVRARPLAFVIASVVLLVLVFAVSYFVSHNPDNDEIVLANHALQLEQQKNWPEALKEYAKLGDLNDSVGMESLGNAARLKNLIDQENSLYAKAQNAESSGNFSRARQLFQESANLHGDKEQMALQAAALLNTVSNPPVPSPPTSKPAAGAHPTVVTNPPPPAQPSAKSPSAKCELLESDYAKMLDRADRNLANGHYGDAMRQYNSVLACDSRNERARVGLERARMSEPRN